MFSNLNQEIKKIESTIKREQEKFGSIGSEGLLLGLVELDSSCSYILQQYGLSSGLIEEELKRLIVLRKNDSEYTHKFVEIMKVAQNAALLDDEEEIFDDHLLFALLSTPNSIALDIIKKQGIEVDDILDDLNNIYNLNIKEEPQNNFLFNLTKEIKSGNLSPFIGRDELVEKVIRILSKKQKNNPMLIGSAGVGKSALVEGVASKLIKTNPDLNIYRLDLGVIIAGTKYRGDLEERFLEIIEKIKNPNSIVFIDEIHNIVGSGSSEGTLDIANILKPILSRNEIKCIGATTLDEYYRFIEKDKALARRFQNVFIEEASKEETYNILAGIADCYQEFHVVEYSDEILKYIIATADFLTNRKFPDKAIDILDEAGLLARSEDRVLVEKRDVDKIVFENLGIKYSNISKVLTRIKNFPILKKYYQLYFMNLGIRKTIMNLQVIPENIDLILEDLQFVFGVENEVFLNLDLSSYDKNYSSSLIGSPAGYVGYNEGGILTEHVIKYPIAIVIIRNYANAAKNIKLQINSILENGLILDSKGRKVSFRNTVFLFIDKELESNIGFLEQAKQGTKKINELIDEVLEDIPENIYYSKKINNLTQKLRDYNYYIDVECANIGFKTYNDLLAKLSDLDNFEKEKKYTIECNQEKVNIKVKR